MTPRERVLTILKGEKPDQVPWFGDLDYWATAQISQGKRPEDFKTSDAYLEWHGISVSASNGIVKQNLSGGTSCRKQ